jgi:hypothetical protein
MFNTGLSLHEEELSYKASLSLLMQLYYIGVVRWNGVMRRKAPNSITYEVLPTDSIKVPPVHRILRDIEGLAQSIGTVGLINPITVDENKVLKFGGRRLAAFKLLKMKEIPCIVVSG